MKCRLRAGIGCGELPCRGEIGGSMRIVIAGLVIALTFAWAAPGHAAMPMSTKYASCADLLAVYPNGVAQSKAKARAAVRNGFARPRVSSTLYKANNGRLDRDRDGVMCEQSR